MTTTWTVPATVVRVVDGDTIHLLLDLGWHITLAANCRIAGINSPETSTVAGIEAKKYAALILPPGLYATFVSHSLDKYGRPLGSLNVQGHDFATQMLAAGHAVEMKS